MQLHMYIIPTGYRITNTGCDFYDGCRADIQSCSSKICNSMQFTDCINTCNIIFKQGSYIFGIRLSAIPCIHLNILWCHYIHIYNNGKTRFCMLSLKYWLQIYIFRINEVVITRIIQDMADISTPLKQVYFHFMSNVLSINYRSIICFVY